LAALAEPDQDAKNYWFCAKKQAKIPIFDLLKKTDFLDAHFVYVLVQAQHHAATARVAGPRNAGPSRAS
jgi:hypothetical protein